MKNRLGTIHSKFQIMLPEAKFNLNGLVSSIMGLHLVESWHVHVSFAYTSIGFNWWLSKMVSELTTTKVTSFDPPSSGSNWGMAYSNYWKTYQIKLENFLFYNIVLDMLSIILTPADFGRIRWSPPNKIFRLVKVGVGWLPNPNCFAKLILTVNSRI